MGPRHLFLPGLGTGHLEGGWSRTLRDRPPRQHARLVQSFAVSVAAVEATLRCGAPPREHGVLFADEVAADPALEDALHRRDDFLLEAAPLARQVARLDEVLAGFLDAAGPSDLVLVSSGPGGRGGARIVEIPTDALEAAGLRVRVEPGFALCSAAHPDAQPTPDLRAHLLGTPGIERILDPTPESAGAWMAPADRGWILLPEPGFRFPGETPAPAPGAPVLLAFGPEWPRPWPEAVHDWRVAPTLRVALGRTGGSSFDEPLAGADALRS